MYPAQAPLELVFERGVDEERKNLRHRQPREDVDGAQNFVLRVNFLP